MGRTAVILVVAAVLGVVPAEAAAQHAAKHLRLSSAAHADRRHAKTPHQTPNALLRLRSTVEPLSTRAAAAVPLELRATRTVPVRLGWSATDVTLATAFAAALLIDAGQTRGLAREGWRGWRETNPILGPRPSVGQLDTYTAVTGLAVLGAAAAVPARVRPWLLGAAFAVEAFTIAGTVQRGVAIRLP
ncbi:MAG TPA: hypothetical protein VFU41_10105 [Gemmatimonadales bacterium]|nr:hypothetical protein [Gemmatimonadales bacterium]